MGDACEGGEGGVSIDPNFIVLNFTKIFHFSVSYVGEGYGGLCKAPSEEERRKQKAKRRVQQHDMLTAFCKKYQCAT